ncbi:mitochondrial carrier [Ascobolus immersus RN42]|uniref:Mitochondrial carrier n=1 Tax=Ascobolus immersus RN42 TaxID=1160509 RepID=A0A3N4I711_ASCIM|nr:mitochondrial carrier [Ascobolus immersus RN42]
MSDDNVLHAIAGAGGGILSTLLTYPLLTLSTRSQIESRRASSSFVDAARRIIDREGLTGLYSGLESAIFGISVTNFVYYYWYEWSRSALHVRSGGRPGARIELGVVQNMLAGALAGSATVLITNPIWVVNTRMTAKAGPASVQSSAGSDAGSDREGLPTIEDPSGTKALQKKKLSTIGAVLKIAREEGWGAFFKGVAPALVLVANPILQYTVFEWLKKKVTEKRGVRNLDAKMVFVLGALAKLVATASTYPYITVKSRMHVAKTNDKKGMVQALKDIIKREGWAGLYGGIGPKLIQSVITAAFLFAFKDALFLAAVQARSRAALVKRK